MGALETGGGLWTGRGPGVAPVGAETGSDALVEEGPDEDREVGGFAEEMPVEVEGCCWMWEGWRAGHCAVVGVRCGLWLREVGSRCRERR